MNIAKREHWCRCYPADQQIPQLLRKVDAEIAAKVCQGGCLVCGGKLHRANYPRKPRGLLAQEGQGNQSVYRDSFCCDQDDCRKRHTPPSVRFLGRKVYRGLVVVLVSAMRHGLNSKRLEVLRESLGMDRRTVERWRAWWLHTFAQSPFWQAMRARFSPPLAAEDLPGELCEAFDLERRDRLLDLLKFLSPITTDSIPWTWSG
ncbi:MAG: hypothetical protein AAB654_03415 [Acidobacteriota bacterium]